MRELCKGKLLGVDRETLVSLEQLAKRLHQNGGRDSAVDWIGLGGVHNGRCWT